eukprot:gene7638-10397_t
MSSLNLLNVHDCHKLTSNYFIQFMNNQSLTSLDISECILIQNPASIIESFGLNRIFLKSLTIGSKYSIDEIINDKTIFAITEYHSSLHHLEIIGSQNSITSAGIIAMYQSLHQLEKLIIGGLSHHIKPDTITLLTNNLSNLRFLSINNSIKLGDEAVTGIANKCKKLTQLSLNNNRNLSNKSFHSLSNLTNLQSLSIQHLVMKNNSIKSVISSLQQLTSLNLSQCFKLMDESMNILTESLKNNNLLEFDISYCMLISDISLRHIAMHLTSLKCLNLKNCVEITDDGCVIITHTVTKLESLNISGCYGITNYAITEIAKNLPRLSNIDISSCGFADNHAVKMLLSHLHNLTEVDFSHLKLLTDHCFEQINNSFIHQINQNINDKKRLNSTRFNVLSSIILQECYGITNKGLLNLLSLFPNSLNRLSISGCGLINDEGIINGMNYMLNITNLDLSHCWLITDEAVHYITINLSKLRILNLRDCINISYHSVEWIRLSNRMCHMEVLNLRDCVGLGIIIEDFRHFHDLPCLKVVINPKGIEITNVIFHT